MGLSDAVRAFLMHVVAKTPFVLKVPNAETQEAMQEARTIMAARHQRFAAAAELFDDLEKNSGK